MGGYALGEREGLLIGWILTLGINGYAFWLVEGRLRELFGAQQIEGQDPWGIIPITQRFSKKVRIPVPEVYLIPVETPTAFALGVRRKKGSLILSQGLLDKFSRTEIEAVVAYLVSEIQRRDTLSHGIGSALAEVFLAPALFLDSIIGLSFLKKRKRFQVPVFKSILSPLALLFVSCSTSKNSYFTNDSLAARLVENPETVAQVLWKLRSYASTQPFRAPLSAGHLFIVSPLTLKGFNRYLQIQPPVELRIQKLVGRFPL